MKTRIEQHLRIEPVGLKIDSDPANLATVREAVEQLCRSAGFDEVAIGEVGLVVNEAHANIIRHAYDNQPGKPIEIHANYDGEAVVITLRDWGNGVNPMDLPQKWRDPMTPGGLWADLHGKDARRSPLRAAAGWYAADDEATTNSTIKPPPVVAESRDRWSRLYESV